MNNNLTLSKKKMKKTTFIILITFLFPFYSFSDSIPNLLGVWEGENKTYSDMKGMKTWEKKIEINKQKDRRFQGSFTYTDGTKNFFGVIHPDNTTITWVSSNSRGYNMGRILSDNTISACYVESGIDATVGCAVLERK
tara:strand:+ start:648 stop:1061 length:414 start_codon:yes stop_codon:yes gene_type:complete